MKIYAHIVRSLDLADHLQVTRHESVAAAVAEQTHRRDECQHHQVIVMPVATQTIELSRGATVDAYRVSIVTRKATPARERRAGVRL